MRADRPSHSVAERRRNTEFLRHVFDTREHDSFFTLAAGFLMERQTQTPDDSDNPARHKARTMIGQIERLAKDTHDPDTIQDITERMMARADVLYPRPSNRNRDGL